MTTLGLGRAGNAGAALLAGCLMLLLALAGAAAADGQGDQAVILRDQAVIRPLGGARFEVLRLVRVVPQVTDESLTLELPLTQGARDLDLVQGFDGDAWSGELDEGTGALAAAGPAETGEQLDFVYVYEATLESVREMGPGDWVPGPPEFLWQADYAYPVDGLQLLTPVGMFEARAQGSLLAPFGPAEVAGMTLDIWQLTDLPGGPVTINLLPVSPGTGGADGGTTPGVTGANNPLAQLDGTWVYLAPVAAALSAALLWAALGVRRRGEGAGAETPGGPSREELVDHIAQLDLEAAASELNPEEYRSQRQRLLQQIREGSTGEGGR